MSEQKDTRNVIDYYKYWTQEAIKADLDTKRNNFGILISNLQHDFNIATIIRNANAFVAKEVIIYGRTHYDKRGTVGTHNYTTFKRVRVSNELPGIISDYDCIVGIDNLPGATPIDDFQWEEGRKYLMCFGQEQIGLPPEILSLCQHVLYIRQFGSVRSLNVGCASSIAMYDYCGKMVK